MAAREHDPVHLDLARLAAEGGLLHGVWPAAQLPRLLHTQCLPEATAAADVGWRARGERRACPGGADQVWLHLELDTTVWLTCQRCLQPLAVTLALAPSIRFVAGGEAQAEAEDARCEEDVLALARSLDLRELAEEELLLGLPLVPRHASCPVPLVHAGSQPTASAADAEPAVNPFAALAALKKPAPGG